MKQMNQIYNKRNIVDLMTLHYDLPERSRSSNLVLSFFKMKYNKTIFESAYSTKNALR